MKVINVQSKNSRTKNGALRNSSVNWIFLLRVPIHNHPKQSITEKNIYIYEKLQYAEPCQKPWSYQNPRLE